MKKIYMIVFLLLFSGAVFAIENSIEEGSVAGVAILKFVNNTGSSNYDWLATSLPDAVYESMLEEFEFKRTSKEWVQGIADESLKTDSRLDLADIRFIAENTSSDIIIYGSYTFDEKTKKINISTRIFHLSRNSITAQIITDTSIDTSMFNVVEKVAKQSVNHIEEVALEDEAERVRVAETGGKKEIKSPPEKKEKKKIVLKKAAAKGKAEPYKYDSWNIGLYGGISKPYGVLDESLQNDGPFGIVEVTTSYRNFWFAGTRLSYNKLNNSEYISLAGELVGFETISLQVSGGLQYILFNRLVIQPYFSPGIAFIKTAVDNGNSYEDINSYMNIIITAGLRIPIRVFGVFITPFIEYNRILDPGENFGMYIIGAGVNF